MNLKRHRAAEEPAIIVTNELNDLHCHRISEQVAGSCPLTQHKVSGLHLAGDDFHILIQFCNETGSTPETISLP
jgi:hypothetical protein